MPRVDHVKKSRKEHKCSNCTRPIEVGSSYRRWRRNFQSDYVLCNECPTPPRSFFTTSEIKAVAWDLIDEEIESFETQEKFEDIVRGYEERIREELVDLIQEKLDNIESGIGHTDVPVYEELEERKDEIEAWADDVANIDSGEFLGEGDACDECSLSEDDGPHWEPTEEDYHGFNPVEEFDIESALEALQDALGLCPE